MNIVLYEPEIPLNTGNIGRTCVAAHTRLHLVGPLGFSLEQKEIRRAGLDYWPQLDYRYYEDYEAFLEANPGASVYYATTKAHRVYTEVAYEPDCFLMFGPESRGIPEEILREHEDRCVRIPMYDETRSLNLSNSAAILLYEALRQQGFPGLKRTGELHRLTYLGEGLRKR